MKRGGVGWYPRSHFIHLDSGARRTWQLEGVGFDRLLAGGKGAAGFSAPDLLKPPPPHHVLSEREIMVRHRALAWQEYLIRNHLPARTPIP
jgi:hypothetical protein